MREPIEGFGRRAINRTLHGRSVYRWEDVPGHNVFRGYSEWERNGHVGVGDALDLYCEPGTAVVAPGCCRQVRHYNGGTRREVIYLEGEGWLAVLAHITAASVGVGREYDAGEVCGRVRGDLGSPHLHFELWLGDRAVAGRTPEALRRNMVTVFRGEPEVTVVVDVSTGRRLATIEGRWGFAPGGDHSEDQSKLYLRAVNPEAVRR